MIVAISARGKHPDDSILSYLSVFIPDLPFLEFDSAFGFLEKSSLDGGRNFICPELSPEDVTDLHAAGIGVRISLTNHYVEEDEYRDNQSLLELFHRMGNAAIVTNDRLAGWIRGDYPNTGWRSASSRISTPRCSAADPDI